MAFNRVPPGGGGTPPRRRTNAISTLSPHQDNKLQCQSLHTASYCCFHGRLHGHHSSFRHTDATREHLIPGQHADTKRATALLYGLQLASMNTAVLEIPNYTDEEGDDEEATRISQTVLPSPIIAAT